MIIFDVLGLLWIVALLYLVWSYRGQRKRKNEE